MHGASITENIVSKLGSTRDSTRLTNRTILAGVIVAKLSTTCPPARFVKKGGCLCDVVEAVRPEMRMAETMARLSTR
jgi:hypothetical protein